MDADEHLAPRFAFECVAEVAARALAAEPPSYAAIMELDRKVREFPVPPDVVAVVDVLNAVLIVLASHVFVLTLRQLYLSRPRRRTRTSRWGWGRTLQ